MTVDDILGLFVLVPIVRGRAVPANQQIADLTLGYCMPALIGNQSLVAWYKLAAAARFYFAGTITDKNVQYLRAADTVKNVYIEFFPPAPQDIGGQSLPGRDAGTNGGEIETLLCIRQGEHARVERGTAIEDGRAVLLHNLEHVLRQWPPGIVYSACSDSEGKVQVIAETISKVEFRG